MAISVKVCVFDTARTSLTTGGIVTERRSGPLAALRLGWRHRLSSLISRDAAIGGLHEIGSLWTLRAEPRMVF